MGFASTERVACRPATAGRGSSGVDAISPEACRTVNGTFGGTRRRRRSRTARRPTRTPRFDSRRQGQLLGPVLFEIVLGTGQGDRLDVVPEGHEVAVVGRKNMAGLARGDHEARLLRVGEIVEATKS